LLLQLPWEIFAAVVVVAAVSRLADLPWVLLGIEMDADLP
jgi:hypothetical protein